MSANVPLPLHVAVANTDIEAVKIFLNKKADNENSSTLHVAIQNGNPDIEKLVAHGSSVNLTDSNGDTVLHIACRVKNLQIIKLLLNYGSNVNAQNLAEYTSLHIAAEDSCTEIVELLLKSRSDVNLVNNCRDSALHMACRKNNLQIVQLLLNYKCNVNIPNENLSTALHVASKSSSAEIVALLLQAGAVIDTIDDSGNTALLIACTNGNVQVVQLLLTNGCDGNFQNKKLTAIYLATKHGFLDVVEVLLKSGVNADVCNLYGNSPLHIACKSCNHSTYKFKEYSNSCKINYVEIVRLLVQYGCNTSLQNKNHDTPLHYAVKNNCTDLAEILLQSKADVNLVDQSHYTVLHYASKLRNKRLFELLLNYGCNVRTLNCKRETPLHVAAKESNIDIIKLLLKAGANPNFCNGRGITAFHYACKSNNIEMIRLLISFGYKINYIIGQTTALMYAVTNNKPDIVELLLLSGAIMDIPDIEDKNTALHLACKMKNIEMVKILLKYGCSIDVLNEAYLSPVIVAAMNGARDIVGLLLDWDSRVSLPEFVWIYYNIRKMSNIFLKSIMKRNELESCNSLLYIKKLEPNGMVYFKRKCIEEIKKLKKHKILHTRFTIYDMLTKDFNSFMTCLKNDHVYQALKPNLALKFPLYYRMICIKYDKGLRRKALLEKCTQCFSKLFSELPKLPFECIEIILSRLDDRNLFTIIHIVSPFYKPLPFHHTLMYCGDDD